jgi:hypothetical protein
MRAELWKIAQLAMALWLIPFLPLLVVVLAAWASSWAIPSIAVVLFMCGWPWAWYKWLGLDEESAE